MRFKNVFGWVRRWHICILLTLAALLLLGLWLEREQSELAGSVLRLHVLANSDSDEDQSLKLKVRDRILIEAEKILPEQGTIDETAQVIEDNLSRFAAAGQEVVEEEGFSYPVGVELTQAWFPTKEYDGFSLPAGEYQALRVTIGEGDGQNWWCVVFPPLCLNSVSESVEETACSAGMDEEQVALITGESEGYVVKFKVLELWDKIKLIFRDETSA